MIPHRVFTLANVFPSMNSYQTTVFDICPREKGSLATSRINKRQDWSTLCSIDVTSLWRLCTLFLAENSANSSICSAFSWFQWLSSRLKVFFASRYNQKCTLCTLVSKSNITLAQRLRLKIPYFFYLEILVGWSALLSLCQKKKLKPRTIQNDCLIEPRHEKTNVLHMRKQRRRSASR